MGQPPGDSGVTGRVNFPEPLLLPGERNPRHILKRKHHLAVTREAPAPLAPVVGFLSWFLDEGRTGRGERESVVSPNWVVSL